MTRANRSAGYQQPTQRQGHAGAARPGSDVSRRAARSSESELAEVYELPLEIKKGNVRGLRAATDPGPVPDGDIDTLRAWLVELRANLKRGGFI